MQSDAPLLQSSDPIAQRKAFSSRGFANGIASLREAAPTLRASPRASEASLRDAPRSLLPRSGTAQTLRCVALSVPLLLSKLRVSVSKSCYAVG
ncbi:MAG: hypothetical protein V7L25_21710, partial [Nostoc sp.]